jgi:hypothetical protein
MVKKQFHAKISVQNSVSENYLFVNGVSNAANNEQKKIQKGLFNKEYIFEQNIV